MRVFLTAFLLMVVAAVGLGFLAMHELRAAVERSDKLLEDDTRDLAAVHALVIDSEHAGRKARTFLLTGEERFLVEYRQTLVRMHEDLATLDGLIDSPEGRRLLAFIQKEQEAVNQLTFRTIALRQRGDIQGAIDLLLRDLQPERDRLDEAFATLVAYKQQRIERDQDAFNATRQRAFRVIYGGLGVVTLLALALGTLVWRTAREQRRATGFEHRLLGIVGHDLRSPLAAVSMSAEQLERMGGLTPVQAKAVERIRRGVHRMVRLINSLLDFNRAREGRLQLMPESVSLHEIGARVLEELRAAHPERTFHCDAQGDTQGEWDLVRLEQLTLNLLENAVKYSPPDTPIRALYRDEGEQVLLSVHNQGPPIPESLRPRLFHPFERGEDMTTVRTSAGLGLYIVWHIVQAHGGSVQVHSTHEEGTTFTVCLPRRISPEAIPG
ncbi:MAG TPA: ATP-binding protein [Archangium sp.]|nr:ATP-binding protein [Archangium sp.]